LVCSPVPEDVALSGKKVPEASVPFELCIRPRFFTVPSTCTEAGVAYVKYGVCTIRFISKDVLIPMSESAHSDLKLMAFTIYEP
jgi:hypothetical protein